MIFHFNKGNINLHDEDQMYFEEKFLHLKTFLGNEAGDEDSVDVRITMEKNKHHSGNRFEGTSTIVCPHKGKFHAEAIGETITQLADVLHEKLKVQMKKFHEKHLGK